MSKPEFKIKDGVLIKCYDRGCGRIEVPDTVTEIGENAFNSFADCRRIKEIILPETVKKIHYNAFCAGWSDYGLERVNIPSSVEWLSTHMFENDYYIKSMPIESGSYLVGKYKKVYHDVPLPYISTWPLPINSEAYRRAFEKTPYIKKIFINWNRYWMRAVSVDEFLSLIDELCKINKLYMCKYEWEGNLASNFSGGYSYWPISPREICFENMPDCFKIEYVKDTLHEDRDGWPACRHDTSYISSKDSRKVCFDTSEDNMSDYYGGNGYIELLANIEDSSVYESYAQKHPAVIQKCRERESELLRTFVPYTL